MNRTNLIHRAGWSSAINGVASIASSATLVIFFAVGGFWGKLNDSITVIYALSFMPLALFFYYLNAPANPSLGKAITAVGLMAMAVYATLQALLVLDVVRFEQTLTSILWLGSVIGLWLLVSGLMARDGQALPAGLIWVMSIYGISFMLTVIAWMFVGQTNPVTMASFLTGTVTGPIWALWLAWWLWNGRILTSTS